MKSRGNQNLKSEYPHWNHVHPCLYVGDPLDFLVAWLNKLFSSQKPVWNWFLFRCGLKGLELIPTLQSLIHIMIHMITTCFYLVLTGTLGARNMVGEGMVSTELTSPKKSASDTLYAQACSVLVYSSWGLWLTNPTTLRMVLLNWSVWPDPQLLCEERGPFSTSLEVATDIWLIVRQFRNSFWKINKIISCYGWPGVQTTYLQLHWLNTSFWILEIQKQTRHHFEGPLLPQ